MTKLPDHFSFPYEIEERLKRDVLSQYGSVMRDVGGRVVEHLRDQSPSEKRDELTRGAANAVKNPWVMATLGLSAAVVAGAAMFGSKRRRRVRALVGTFSEALDAYLARIRDGTLDAAGVERLGKSVDAIASYSTNSRYKIALSGDEASAMLTHIADYTEQLAQANGFELENVLDPESPAHGDPFVVDLRRYLDAQLEIFRRTAATRPDAR